MGTLFFLCIFTAKILKKFKNLPDTIIFPLGD